MKSKNHHIIGALLVCCMLLVLLPAMGTTAQAASVSSVPSGYKGIYTASDLDSIRNDLDGNYILMNDIDLSSFGKWTPIGTGWSGIGFTGTFDGNGYAIKHMVIDDSSVIKDYNGGYQYAGLFATLKGATVKNIRYISGSISCENSPCLEAGAVAGCAYGSTISKCASYVNISYKYGKPDGNVVLGTSGIAFNCGGIVGHIQSDSYLKCTTISECENHAMISGISGSAPMAIGGIVGDAFTGDVIISDCCNIASMQVDTNNNSSNVGGILGSSLANITISNCYNIGPDFKCKVGKKDGINSYSNVGGIAGSVAGWKGATTIKNCYYVDECQRAEGYVTSNWNYTAISAEMCNTSALQKQSTYSGYDFNTVWQMSTGSNAYPVLRWRTEDTTTSTGTTTNGKTGCSEHKYKSASGNICTVCGYEYEPQLNEFNRIRYAVKDNVPVRNNYYSKSSKVVGRLSKGDSVKVTHWLKNALGNNWYITEDGYYIYADNLSGTSPYAHTLTFDANGGSGAPEAVTTAGYKYGISSTNVPTRSGYSFLGWSTNKNATTVEYKAGQSIRLDKDITLYAVWERDDDYIAYRNKVDVIKASIGDKDICENQINGIKKSGSTYVSKTGLCNISSVVTLLNRNLYYEGKENNFTILDAFSANGCTVTLGPTQKWTGNTYNRDGYVYTGNTASWACELKYKNASGTTYTVVNESLVTINKNKGTRSYEDYFAKLLHQHPEGICIRKRIGESGHVCVITDYEIIDGKYQFYVQDPVNRFTGKFEGSYQFKTYGDISANIDFIAYIS